MNPDKTIFYTVMKKYLIYFSLVPVLFSCNRQAPVSGEETAGSSIHAVSRTYKPRRFNHDERKEKIKSAAPELQRLFEEQAKTRKIPGIAWGVVVDNELVASGASGVINLEQKTPATTGSCFRIASMTKSFTAMAILKLRDEGKLSLNDPVAKYIPEMANQEYLTSDSPVIDIENLLTMTAGFPEDNPWGDRQLDEPDQMLMDLVASGISLSNPPSYKYEYSNTGYALLGNIVTRISGMPFQEYIKANILQPLGMDHTYYEFDSVPKDQLAIGYRWEDDQWKLEPMLHNNGSYGAMGGLITSIEDFAKYVGLHLSAWPYRSDPDNGPVKRSTLREMQNPQFSRLYADAKDWNGNACGAMSGYGFGLGSFVDCHGIRVVSHGGALPGFGSKYIFFPEYGVGVMAFGNRTYTGPLPYDKIMKLLFEKLDLQPRKLPPSDILLERQKQVAQLIEHWDNPDLEEKILAENFYLDRSRERRMQEIQEILNKAGGIQKTDEIKPENQLRGSFKIKAKNGYMNVYFTLTPEKVPKVQDLEVSFHPNKSE